MSSEIEWPPVAVPAPFCGTEDREGASIERLGGIGRAGGDGPGPLGAVPSKWRPPLIDLAPTSRPRPPRARQCANRLCQVARLDQRSVLIVAEPWSRTVRKPEIWRLSAGGEALDD